MANVTPKDLTLDKSKPFKKPSCWQQYSFLIGKNIKLQKRDVESLMAEYWILPLYMIFWVKVMMWVFPDDRPTLEELRDTEAELNRVIPTACYFAAQTVFVPATIYATTIMERLGAACGMDNATTFATFRSFNSISDFEVEYLKKPENIYAMLYFDETKANTFSIYHNESLTAGRYLPNMDETTLKMKDPPLAYVPALTTRGTVLAFGDNRLADLASKAQHAVVGSPRMIPDAIHLKPFPFDKARCDGIGCVMKYTWPSLIGSVFFITIQSFLTRVGQEKERGIKEALYVAGTSQWAYWASWLTAKSFDMIFPSLIFSVLLFATEIFIKQNFAFIFFSCYLFGIASLVQMIFVQALLKTGQQIMMAGVMLLVLGSAIYYPVRLLGIDKGWSDDAANACFLFPPVAISHIFWELADHEGRKIELDVSKNPLIGSALWMMAISIVFWGFIGFYFEQIMPQNHGPALEQWNFIFSGKYWKYFFCSGKKDEAKNNLQKYSPGDEEYFDGVRIQQLVKEFNVKDEKGKASILRAVDNLTVDFHAGQVAAVLGHNGAGKTTSIRMMTGSHAPTSGKIYIDGVDGLENANWVRENVGVCPQHDVLYDNLTAGEHVELFGGMKGEVDVMKTLNSVDLGPKRDELVKSFSGGQKRRLSVALALLGDPKLIVLDEPTTGMDVVARQSVWKMIESKKKGRCIILTTHSMEEADALGDRVVVIGKGKVQAQGTSLDLKNKFGIGYHLHIVKDLKAMESNKFQLDDVVKLITKHVGEDSVKLLTDIGAECSFAVPRDKTPTFPDLFTALNENKENLGIEQVALSQTTLEEVFMELGKKEKEEEKKKEEEEKKDSDGKSDVENAGKASTDGENSKKAVDLDVVGIGGSAKGGSFTTQTYGGLYLVLNTYKRDPSAICCLMIWPIMLVIVAGIIYMTRELDTLESIAVVPYKNPPASFPYVIIDSAQSTYAAKYVQNITSVTGSVGKEYATKAAMDVALSAGEGVLGYQFGIVFDSLKYNGTKMDALNIELLLNDTDIEFKQARQIAAMVTNVGLGINGKQSVTPTYVEMEKGPSAQMNAVAWGAGGLMIIISSAFAYLSAFYSEGMARDRILNRRVHLFVSSMGRPQYYMGRFIADFVSLLIPLLLTPIIMAMFAFPSVLQSNIGAYFLLVILFAPSGVAFGYVISWLFPSIEAAQEWGQELVGIVTIMPFFLTSFILTDANETVHSFLGLIPGYAVFRGLAVLEAEAAEGKPYLTTGDLFNSDRSLVWVYIILIIDGFLYWFIVVAIDYAEAPYKRCMDKMKRMQVKSGAENDEAVQLASGSAFGGGEVKPVLHREPDARVITEEDAVKGGATKMLTIKGIEKKFIMNNGGINHAVKGVFLGVEKGEIFGLLGMNGAGKTTLMNAIQGKHVPTSGDCLIDGTSSVTEIDAARKKFGICPQHDIIWDEVTPREHLIAFANIRGVAKEKIAQLAGSLLQRLDVIKKADAPAKTLSGGQKRKLSIAMAVIGNPRCVFLDEPTTGLDPNTRRFVWDYILELKENRAVVLTTHSMEEADALCARIGIMVNGKLKTLGTPQQLKAQYGTGYGMIIRLKGDVENDTEILEKILKEKFGEDCTLDDIVSTATYRAYRISQGELDFGDLFRSLEENKEAFGLLDYSITQTTMDQVFKNFAKFQLGE